MPPKLTPFRVRYSKIVCSLCNWTLIRVYLPQNGNRRLEIKSSRMVYSLGSMPEWVKCGACGRLNTQQELNDPANLVDVDRDIREEQAEDSS